MPPYTFMCSEGGPVRRGGGTGFSIVHNFASFFDLKEKRTDRKLHLLTRNACTTTNRFCRSDKLHPQFSTQSQQTFTDVVNEPKGLRLTRPFWRRAIPVGNGCLPVDRDSWAPLV